MSRDAESPPRRSPVTLSRREREIVNAIFAVGNRASVEDIRGRLTEPPSDSSVRVLLTRLERKGVVRHQLDGGRNLYTVRMSAATAKRRSLQEHVATFFDGSARQMLMSLVREGTWTREDLDALRAEIDRVRKAQKKS
jgi:predicted transcriptional regulator